MLFLFEFFYLSLKYYKVIVLLEFILLFTIVIRAMCVKIELASYTNKDDS